MTQVLTNSMPIGVPGDISRSGADTCDQVLQHATYPVTAYGLPIVDDSGAAKGVTDGSVGADIKGFLVRAFPSLGGLTTNEDWGTSTPPVSPAVLTRLKRGYLFVKVLYGTPAKEGQVHVRVAATSGARLQGGIETAKAQTVTSPAIVGTGAGTIACSIDDVTKCIPGTYKITLLSTSQTAAVSVIDPNGNRLKDGVVGTEYIAQGFKFTITAGGTMTAADNFSPVVTDTTIAIPRAYFTGAMDADNTAEVAYSI